MGSAVSSPTISHGLSKKHDDITPVSENIRLSWPSRQWTRSRSDDLDVLPPKVHRVRGTSKNELFTVRELSESTEQDAAYRTPWRRVSHTYLSWTALVSMFLSFWFASIQFGIVRNGANTTSTIAWGNAYWMCIAICMQVLNTRKAPCLGTPLVSSLFVMAPAASPSPARV